VTYQQQLVDNARGELFKKIQILSQIQEKESIVLPIGSEWHNVEFADTIKVKELGWIRDNDETDVIGIEAEAGAVVEAHRHDNSETIMCAKGEVHCPINNKTLRKSDIWVIPAGMVHQLEFKKDSQLVVMWHPKLPRE
jgi:quercetin dioxygenase-like cupin family protein